MKGNRSHTTFHTVIVWLFVALIAEPHANVLGQPVSIYGRALEVLMAQATPAADSAKGKPVRLAQAQVTPIPLLSAAGASRSDVEVATAVDTNLLLNLTRTPITLTNGNQLVALSFFSESNHNYVVEYRDNIGQDLCNNWQPLTNAPHNFGIVFTEANITNRFYRLRRIDVPRSPLFALLANDTGTNSLDGITSDPTLMGMALTFPNGTVLQGALDHSGGPYITITNLDAPRHFVVTREMLNLIQAGPLPDGPHTVYLRAEQGGQTLATHELTFVLDTTPPVIQVTLAPESDTTPLNDGRTETNPVTLVGQTESGTRLELLAAVPPVPGGQSGWVIHSVVPDAQGAFVLTNVVLAEGTNQFYFRALDAACNETNTVAQICWYGPNCTFPDKLDGWQVYAAPTAGKPGSVIASPDKSCNAVMTEGDSFLVTLSRELVIPTLPSTLNLTYAVSFDTTTPGAMRDAFEVDLVDADGRPLTYTIQGTNAVTPASQTIPDVLPPHPDACLNHGDGHEPFSAYGIALRTDTANPALRMLSIDVSHLPPGSRARLILRLVNNDGDPLSLVEVGGITLEATQFISLPTAPLGAALSNLTKALGTSSGPGTETSPCQEDGFTPSSPSAISVVEGVLTTNSPFRTPSILIASPGHTGRIAVGSILIQGTAIAHDPTNRIVLLTVNQRPVDALDVAGNFFSAIEIKSGESVFEVVASDVFNQRTTNTVSVHGTICPQDFASLGEVTASVEAEYGRTSFNEWTKVLYADVALRNAGNYPIRAPFFVGVTRISDPSVRLLASDGVSADGIPYYDYSGTPNTDLLNTGEITASRALAFHNPNHVQFTYDLAILGHLNQAPYFTTVPVIAAVIDRPYVYDVDAMDPEGDVLSFSLSRSPAFIGINQTNGILSGIPSTNDRGTHDVTVRVSDNRGGSAEQRYLLSVIPPPPNRPPYFESIPMVLATVTRNDGGLLIVANDEWTLSDQGFSSSAGATRFVRNITDLFAKGRPASFLAYSSHFGLTGARLENAIRNFGHQWTKAYGFTLSVDSLRAFDGVFVGGDAADNIALHEYLQTGGNVYLLGGSGSTGNLCCDGPPEAAAWNALLYNYGLAFEPRYNFVSGVIPIINSPHPIFEGGVQLYQGRGQTIIDLDPTDERGVIVAQQDDQGLYAVFDPRFTNSKSYRYPAKAIDPDGDSLLFRLDVFPTGMWIDPTAGIIRWSPTIAQIGPHNVTVQVSDGRGGTATQSYVVTVLPDPANHPPVIVSEPITVAQFGRDYLYDVDAIDPDDDPLRYRLMSGPSSMIIDASSGLLRWSPRIDANTNLPFVPGFEVSTYASITNPAGLAFAVDGTLFVGSDQGELPTADPSSRIRRIPAGGGTAVDYSLDVLVDPDALVVDNFGAIAGVPLEVPQPNAVLVGGLTTGGGDGSQISIILTNRTRRFLFGNTESFINPNKLLIDRLGRLLFSAVTASPGYKTGAVFVTTGESPRELLQANLATASFAVDRAGRIFTLVRDSRGTSSLVDDQLRIQINGPDGSVLNTNFADGIELPARDATTGYFGRTSLAIDPNPECSSFNLFLLHNSRLFHFDEYGHKTEIGIGFKGHAVDMVFGPDDALYVSMANGANEILRLHPLSPVEVAVDDGRGGVDAQCYKLLVDVSLPPLPGEIRGTVFNDLGCNGVWDGQFICNGDFSKGNAGFSSGYTYSPGLVGAAQYTIGTNPVYSVGFYEDGRPIGVSYADHTSQSGSMMIMNASLNPNVILWRNVVPVPPDTRFTFSGWAATFFEGLPNAHTYAKLRVSINGVPIGSRWDAPRDTGRWDYYSAEWNSTTNTVASIEIVNEELQGSGNDFTLDDLSFEASGVLEPVLAGRTVFLDHNDNWIPDLGEPATTSDFAGGYQFTNLPPGKYLVRHVLPGGWSLSAPASGSWEVNLNSGQILTNLNFGSRMLPTNEASQIRGVVFNDLNGEGLRNGRSVVDVRGTSNPWLAGMPNGSHASGPDIAPDQSPVEISGIVFVPGRELTFTSTGRVNNYPGPSGPGPDGGGGQASGAENGIARTTAPINALMAVFLGPERPDLSPTPADLNFFQDGNVEGGVDYLKITPALKQVFFIGDGRTSGNEVQTVVVPFEATRLFLGTMDGFEWSNNTGSFDVRIDPNESEPGLQGWLVYLDGNRNRQRDSDERFTITDENGNYSFANLGSGEYSVAVEIQSGWIQTGPPLGTHTVTLSNGLDAVGIDFGNRRLRAQESNSSPSFVSVPATIAAIGRGFRYSPTVVDPDGDSLTFELLVNPDGMVVQRGTGFVGWTPDANQAGLHSAVLSVQDGRGGVAVQSFQIMVQAGNTAPIITSRPSGPAVVNRSWQYALAAQDADGDPISFRLTEGPGGMSLTNGQLLTWTPSYLQTGLVHVAVSASDGRSSTTQSFELPVVAIASNRPPQIVSQPRSVVRFGDVFSFVVELADPDGDAVTLRLTNSPPGMVLSNAQPASAYSRLIEWRPDALGTNSYELVVSDGRVAVSYRYQITVVSQVTNSAPQIVSRPPATGTVGAGYAYDPAAQDADNDRLGWYLDSPPTGMSIDPSSGSILWTPTLAQLGTNRVVLNVIDGQGGMASQGFDIVVRPVNLAPQFASSPPTLAETDALYQYQVRIFDVENDSLTFRLTTAPEGMGFVYRNDDGSLGTNNTFSTDGDFALVWWVPSASQFGTNRVVIQVQDSAGGSSSQEYNLVVTTNQNGTPVIISSPALFAATNIQYQYQIVASDPDGDSLSFALVDGPSGMVLNLNSGLVQWTPSQVGSYPVSVSARDSQGAASSQSFVLTVTDANHPPVLAIPGARTFTWATLAYTFTAQATDPDGDSIAFSISGPAGMTIRPTGLVEWSPGVSDEGSHRITVTATDARGLASLLQFDLRVGVDRQPPFLQLGCDPTPLPVGSILDIAAFPRDNFGPPTLEVTVDGKPVALDAQNRGEAVFERTGVIPVLARATDFFGNSTTNTCFYTIYDQGFGSLPFVEILSPESDALVTGPTDIVGTVADTNLVSYALSVRPLEGGEFTQIGRGTNVVLTNVLGRLDSTLLANGSYVLRLEAFDSDGLRSSAESTFTVAGELKVGNFRLSFVDLSIPVSGIPVTVARSYDTLQARERSDFGYGWRLEFRDSRLRTSLPPRTPEEIETDLYQRFTDRTRVAVTLPGGKREVFTFKPTPALGPGFQAALGALAPYRPAFEPLRGATARLSIPSNLGPGQSIVLRRNFNGGWDAATDGGTGSLPYNPDDPALGGVYLLQTREGIGYEVEPETGFLLRAGDPNGNTLEFSNNGVTNTTSGVGVSFARNPRGLITSVTDLMGRQIRYEYDQADNLIAVTDRDTNTTRFIYSTNPAQPHYLVRVIDPLGRTGVRVNYDEHGRMTNLVDAADNSVQLVHDIENSVEHIVDTLGNTNTFHYDEFGNVTREVNALGGVTLREYDENFYPTVEVDPLGHTNRFRYDSQGNVLERTDPLGNVTINQYSDLPVSFFSTRYGIPPFQKLLAASIDPLGHVTRSDYDRLGNVLSTTDAAGNVTRYEVDHRGNQTAVTDAAGHVTRLEYDDRGNLLEQLDPLGNKATFAYDPNGNQTMQVTRIDGRFVTNRTEYSAGGRPASVTDALGNTTRTLYDALGNTAATVDALGRTNRFAYDDRGQLLSTSFADGTSNRLAYDTAGRRTSSSDRAGRSTSYEYDALGRLIATTYPDGTRTKTTYDLAGRVIAQFDERTNRTAFAYDPAGRQTVITNALGATTQSQFDNAGRKIADIDALGRTTRFVYDELGRRIQTLFANGTTNRTVYDALGRVGQEIDQAGITTAFGYDSLGRLTSVTNALGTANQTVTVYAYNEAGNLTRQQDALNRVTRYEYDGLGRRVASVLPLGQRSGTLYNSVGNVAAVTNFNRDVIRFDYDANNRLAAKSLPDGTTIHYAYTLTGRRAAITNGTNVTIWIYDVRDRLISRTDPDGRGVAYAYDLAGNRTVLFTTSNGQQTTNSITRFTFDALNRLETVTDPDGGVARYTYDPANNVQRVALPNGTFRTNAYDALNRVTTIAHVAPTGVFSSFRYTLGPTGHRLAVQENTGRQVRYDYDALSRLVRESVFNDPSGPNPTNSFVYDAVGNRLYFTNTLEGVTAYDYDANDQLLTETLGSATTRYAYDDNGNTLVRSNATQSAAYTWDAQNRMVGVRIVNLVTSAATNLSYQYDDDGIRVAAFVDNDETRYLIDANRPFAQVVEEWTSINHQSSTLTASYTHGPHHLISQSRTGARTWYHADGLGSTRALTGQGGSPTDHYQFDAYGRTLAQSGPTPNAYLFAGEQRDRNLGLDYLRARYLNFNAGRFYGRDSNPGVLTRPPSRQAYPYVEGDPIGKRDPSGEYTLTEMAVTIGVATAVFDYTFNRRLGRAVTIGFLYAGSLAALGVAAPTIESLGVAGAVRIVYLRAIYEIPMVRPAFFSGGSSEAQAEAQASLYGAKTLTQTGAGYWLKKLYEVFGQVPSVTQAGTVLSDRFAWAASGRTPVFLDNASRSGWFYQVELGGLRANPRVTSLVIHDLANKRVIEILKNDLDQIEAFFK